jgi:hypothetical protein
MVRAASEGNGALFLRSRRCVRVSRAWLTAQTKTVAIKEITSTRLLMKLRFPQGSEISISGCPKFEAPARTRLTNPEMEAETDPPEPQRWRVVSAYPPS